MFTAARCSTRRAEAAATGCQDHEFISRADLEARRGAEVLHGPAGAAYERLTAGARLSALEPKGRDAAVIGEQCSGERRTKLQPPHDAVAAVMPPGAARAAADRELPHQHRELALQDLRVREPRVGHVGLHGVAAIEIGARAGAAG